MNGQGSEQRAQTPGPPTISRLAGTDALAWAVALVVAILLYTVVLVVRLPGDVGWWAREGRMALLAVLVPLTFGAFLVGGRAGLVLSASATFVLFALPLAGLWEHGSSGANVVGGLLPFNDASGYYWDARRLVEGARFSAFSARRPLFPGLLAGVMALSGQNLQVSLALLAAMGAVACFVLAREARESHGPLVAACVLVVVFLYYRFFIGKTLTEHAGVALGAVALAVLWRAARLGRAAVAWFGVFLLTLALSARAGAFFVLPALLGWTGWSLASTTRARLRVVAGGVVAIALAFSLNMLVSREVAAPGGLAFSNFSFTLYGLAVGGKGWTQVYQDHPELARIPDPALSREVYRLAWDHIRANPAELARGALNSWRDYFNPITAGAYSFLYNGDPGVESVRTRWLLYGLSAVGLAWCIWRRRTRVTSLVGVAVPGILLSVPFVPPFDADNMRAYAATIPIQAALVALGVAGAARLLSAGRVPSEPRSSGEAPTGAVACAAALLVVFLAAPLAAVALGRAPRVVARACSGGLDTAYVRVTSGSAIYVVYDWTVKQTRVPFVRLSDFRRSLDVGYPGLVDELARLRPEHAVVQGPNLVPGRYLNIWLVVDRRLLPARPTIVRACGRFSTNPDVVNFGFLYATSLEPVTEQAR